MHTAYLLAFLLVFFLFLIPRLGWVDISMEGGGGLGKARRGRNGEDKPYGNVDESEVTNRLYVGNLDYGTSWQDLKDHFKPCGTVVFADIFKDGTRSKGCGIVEFETRAEALQALRTLNHTTIGESTFEIFCREDREDKARNGGQRGGAKGAPRNGGGNNSRGASQSQGQSQGQGQGSGVVITTKAYRERMQQGGGAGGAGGRTVFVGNLPFTTTWQDLKDAFASAGRISRADMLQGPDGKSKGAGTLQFETNAGAAKAVSDFHDALFDGRVITVKYDKFAE